MQDKDQPTMAIAAQRHKSHNTGHNAVHLRLVFL